MNAKILSLLFILFLGIGFSSCSKDKNESSFDSGKSQGEKFRTSAYDAYNGDLIKQAEAAVNLYSTYQQYKQNSSDSEWKKGFLGGATQFDESKYSGLETILEKDISAGSILEILPDLIQLLN